MNRVLVSLLSAVDAAIAAAVGLAIALAPLTLVFILGLGGADWGSLWTASAAIWQLGHLVPQKITLPGDYLASAGISSDAASFVLSLTPLAFAAFTAVFAARSGARASRADAWVTGVASSTLVFSAVAVGVALTSGSPVTQAPLWEAMLFPSLVFAVPAVIAAVAVEWQEAGTGAVARARDRVEASGGGWGDVPGLAVRGAAVALVALVGAAALGLAVALVLGGAQVIALYEAANVDALGATVLTLGQLAYLPTVLVWSLSFLVGPGFALGIGTAVSPAGTQLGVAPGIPILGVVPESSSSSLLLLTLLPVAAGALAGWVVRSRLVDPPAVMPVDEPRIPVTNAPWATAALEGLLGRPTDVEPEPATEASEPVGPRWVLTVLIAVLAAAGAALLAAAASGSLGPGRLAEVGPQPGRVALAVCFEVMLGAGILLLAPRRRPHAGHGPDAGWAADTRPDAASERRGRDSIVAVPFASAVHSIPFADEAEREDAAHRPPASAARDARAALAEAGAAPGSRTEPVPLPPLPPLRGSGPDDQPAPRRPDSLPPVD